MILHQLPFLFLQQSVLPTICWFHNKQLAQNSFNNLLLNDLAAGLCLNVTFLVNLFFFITTFHYLYFIKLTGKLNKNKRNV